MDQTTVGLSGTQTAILAGGLGERLRPLTLTVPKPLARVRGRPFLEYQFDLLRRHGARRVLLLVSHLGDRIERHFGDGREWGLEVRYSYEPAPLGTAGALRLALPHLDESFLLLNGDTYLEADLTELVSRYRTSGCAAMMVVYGNPPPQIAPNNVAVTSDGRVSRYRKGEPAGMTHVDAGVYLLARATVEHLEVGRPASLERDVFPRLAEQGALAAFETPVRYYDIGTFERLEVAEKGLP